MGLNTPARQSFGSHRRETYALARCGPGAAGRNPQKLSHKAGAQYGLARVLRKLKERALEPVLLVSEEGWLTRECQLNDIQVLRTPFPSSRSLSGYLYKNRSFTKRVKKRLDQLGVSPPIVQGNDHPEALRTLELAEFLNAKCSLMLRTPTMNGGDYF